MIDFRRKAKFKVLPIIASLLLLPAFSGRLSARNIVIVNSSPVVVDQAENAHGYEIRCVISPYPHGEGRDGRGHTIVVGASLGAGKSGDNAAGNWTLYE